MNTLIRIASALSIATLTLLATAGQSSFAASTQLSLSPSAQTVTPGQTFTVAVNLTTGGASVDTVQVSLNYPSDLLKCTGTSDTSAFTVVPQPDSCSGGNVLVQRGRSAGYTSDGGVVNVSFQAINSGKASVPITAFSQVYSSGQSIPYGTTNGIYTVSSVASTPTPTPTPSPAPTSSPPYVPIPAPLGSRQTSPLFSIKPSTGSSPATIVPTPLAAVSTSTGPSKLTISNVQITHVSANSATVTWETDQASTSKVDFSKDFSFGLTAFTSGLMSSHSVPLETTYLLPGTAYNVRILSVSADGTKATLSTKFRTSGFAVTLTLLDASGKKYSGAKVTLGGKTQTANSAGQVTFTDVNYGKQTVQIAYNGTQSQETIQIGLPASDGTVHAREEFNLVSKNHSSGLILPIIFIIACLLIFTAIVGWIVRQHKIPKIQPTADVAAGALQGPPALEQQLNAVHHDATPAPTPPVPNARQKPYVPGTIYKPTEDESDT